MIERRISAVPVVDASGRLQGIVSEGDLMRHSQQRRRTPIAPGGCRSSRTATKWRRSTPNRMRLTAADVMTRKVVTSTESTPLEKIATLLERHRIKRVPILRRGKVVGVVSRANLLHGLVAQKAPHAQDGGEGPRYPRPHPERARSGRRGQSVRQRRRRQRSRGAVGPRGSGVAETRSLRSRPRARRA